MSDSGLGPGTVAWAVLEPVQGREQDGHRPVLVVSSSEYVESVTSLAIVLPITTSERGWPNHVPVWGPSGLSDPSWIMTEQPRTLARHRITGVAGRVSNRCLATVQVWLADFLDL